MSQEPRGTVETLQVQGGQMLDRVKELIHEGNVRRIVIKQGEHTVVELPLTVGVAAVVIAPMLAAVGALAALLTECTIEVERGGARASGQGGGGSTGSAGSSDARGAMGSTSSTQSTGPTGSTGSSGAGGWTGSGGSTGSTGTSRPPS
jgi:hypothetical protein